MISYNKKMILQVLALRHFLQFTKDLSITPFVAKNGHFFVPKDINAEI